MGHGRAESSYPMGMTRTSAMDSSEDDDKREELKPVVPSSPSDWGFRKGDRDADVAEIR